jgi:uncharacterized protein with GYD domain
MPLYLSRFSYTPEAWAAMIKSPEDRREVARAGIEAAGGKLLGFWYAFGEEDGYTLVEAENNVKAAAGVIASNSGGALRSSATTVLLTVEEMLEALREAQKLPYRPPKG